MLGMLSTIIIFMIALLHAWFLILEMFLWQKPLGLKAFKLDPEFAKRSAVLAANQGLYNGFLSAGLLWSLLIQDPTESLHLKIFFLVCVVLAGVYAGITANRKIFWIQGMPAMVALLLLIF